MGRRPAHLSGPTTLIAVRLSPHHLELLDQQRGRASRGRHIAALLERTDNSQREAADLRAATRRIVNAIEANRAR